MNLSKICFRTAVLMGLVGITAGIGMGMAQDFTLAPAHAHVNLLGWVSFFLYGAFYMLVPSSAEGWLPRIHYGLSLAGAIIMTAGIAFIVTGHPEFEPLAIIGSLVVYAGFLTFIWIVFRAKFTPVTR
jgi:peptidoglycan/LPS O-acetylase OafA/YrhL